MTQYPPRWQEICERGARSVSTSRQGVSCFGGQFATRLDGSAGALGGALDLEPGKEHARV